MHSLPGFREDIGLAGSLYHTVQLGSGYLGTADGRTAGELLDERLKTRSSGLYALARFLRVSLEDKNPSKPCANSAEEPQ